MDENISPKVSVVMPAYNAEAYLDRAIDSVVAQTVADWELVVVDDCSTDRTHEMLERRSQADPRIRVLRTDAPASGVFKVRKKAILAARGQYVLPLDADDALTADYIERMLSVQAATGTDIVLGLMVDSREPHQPIAPWQVENCPESRMLSGRRCFALTLNGWKICMNGLLIKTAIMRSALNEMDSRFSYSIADELLGRKMLTSVDKVAFSEAHYLYTRNPESVSNERSLRRFDYLRNNLELVDIARRLYGESSEEYALAHCQNFHGVFDAYRIVTRYSFRWNELPQEVRHLIKTCRKAVDFGVVKGRVSPRYYALLRIGFIPTHTVLSLLDRISEFLHH